MDLTRLGFLGGRRYDALLALDKTDDRFALRIEKQMMTKSDSLAIDLRPAGGFIGGFTR